MACICAAVGLIIAALALTAGGPGGHGLTFRDIAYGQSNYCTLTPKSDKVHLKRPKRSVGILSLYMLCNYRPATSIRLTGFITVFPGKKFGRGGKSYKVGPYRHKAPKKGARLTFRVKLPKPALTGLKKGRLVTGSFQLNVNGPPLCPGGGCGSRPAGVDIDPIKGVK